MRRAGHGPCNLGLLVEWRTSLHVTTANEEEQTTMSHVAFLIADGFEDFEFQRPFEAVRNAGHRATVIGSESGASCGGKRGSATATAELASADARSQDFDAVMVPGGHAPDRLRTDPDMVRLVREMNDADKPVAAICHAASLLIEAAIVSGRTLTSWPSVKTDVVNAGGNWVDRELVEDGNLITSRRPDDLDVFCRALLQRLDGPRAGG
jgi:protease I